MTIFSSQPALSDRQGLQFHGEEVRVNPMASSSDLAGRPDPDLVRIREVIYQVAGIFHPDNKLRILQERCANRMNALNAPTLREYLEHLTVGPGHQTELFELLNEITVGETCFFRNHAQLDALCQIVIPRILRAKSTTTLRIWSAGCSTGEEPYTINMLLLEATHGPLKNWTIDILATDLNENSLTHARSALYDSYSTRNLTQHYRQKYFSAVGGDLQVQPNARSGVTFARQNLFDDSRHFPSPTLDVIFCCNVLIYFDVASKRRVIRHFYDQLLPHGYLFLGRSESLFGVSDDFTLVHFPGSTGYVKGSHPPAEKPL